MKVSYITQAVAVAAALVAPFATAAEADHGYPEHLAKLIDFKVDPCDDFYQYACGRWLKETELPADKPRYAYSFTTVGDRSDKILRAIMEGNEPIVSEMYQSCMDREGRDARGAEPLKADLMSISQVKTTDEALQIGAKLAMKGLELFYGASVGGDLRNARENALYVGQGKLSMEREYYVDETKFKDVEADFRKYITTVLKLSGFSEEEAKAGSDIVVKIEKEMAAIFLSRAEMRDYAKVYKHTTLGEALKKYPVLLNNLFDGAELYKHMEGLNADTRIITGAIPFLDAAEKYITELPVDSLKTYLAYRVIDTHGYLLSKEFEDARFAFYSNKLYGVRAPRPMEQTCVARVKKALPNLVGKYFFQKASSEEAEDTAKLLVELVEDAMEKNINTIDWLDAETRENALKKLSSMENLIGHSKHVEKLDFPVKSDTFYENTVSIAEYSTYENLKKFNKPVDRTEWGMSAADVNAYYSPLNNQIVFPIGILQNPFFDAGFPAAANFGAIGAVVGHEITHGFDNSGRLFDADGNLKMWWSDSTSEEFEKRADCMREQYSKFELIGLNGDSLGFLNGNQTIGENIADNGGVKLSYYAYQAYKQAKGQGGHQGQQQQQQQQQHHDACGDDNDGSQDQGGDHSTGKYETDKVFFVAYAQNWCTKAADNLIKNQLATGVHAPGMCRVNGVVMNSPEFANTFKCDAGKPMNPAKKCHVW